MPLTEEQVHEAIEQVLVHCDLKMEDYSSISLRGALYTLGFTSEDADQVCQFAYDGGFTYCLDPMFPSKTREGGEPTPEFACYWGPDQLASRLHSLSNYRAKTYVRRWSEIRSEDC